MLLEELGQPQPGLALMRLLAFAYRSEKRQGRIKFEDEAKLNLVETCIDKPKWLGTVCIDYVQLNLEKKFALEVHKYSNVTMHVLKFLALSVWTSPLCERIYFVGNNERSKFAFYTVEMSIRNSEKSLFGKISIESRDMGHFVIGGYAQDGLHVNYGAAPIGEKEIFVKICDLFNRNNNKTE